METKGHIAVNSCLIVETEISMQRFSLYFIFSLHIEIKGVEYHRYFELSGREL